MDTFYHSVQLPATSGIYRITCTSNEKIYIGSAINLRNRQYDHLKELRRKTHRNPKLQNAWNKYGEQSFIFEVLELVLLHELLTAREQYWFDQLKPFGRKGFNICPIAGSNLGKKESIQTIEQKRIRLLGYKHSEESRRKMSKSQTGRTHSAETKEKIRIARIGKTWSPEARARASAIHTGKPSTFLGKTHSAESRGNMTLAHAHERKALIVIAPDGTEHSVHGIRQFCKEHTLDRSALTRVAQGKQTNHKGWKARFPD